ncbi:MAG TPA: hypothetical protein DCS63_00835 [Elusimicrobia bacterium]|nr:hypothetical protein [Elusimicrobiota bacterium]
MKKEFKVDLVLYSAEALRLAANVAGNARVALKKGGGGAAVEVEAGDPEAAFRELMNEALNQQCRMDLVKRNFKTSQLILANALVSALGQKNSREG